MRSAPARRAPAPRFTATARPASPHRPAAPRHHQHRAPGQRCGRAARDPGQAAPACQPASPPVAPRQRSAACAVRNFGSRPAALSFRREMLLRRAPHRQLLLERLQRRPVRRAVADALVAVVGFLLRLQLALAVQRPGGGRRVHRPVGGTNRSVFGEGRNERLRGKTSGAAPRASRGVACSAAHAGRQRSRADLGYNAFWHAACAAPRAWSRKVRNAFLSPGCTTPAAMRLRSDGPRCRGGLPVPAPAPPLAPAFATLALGGLRFSADACFRLRCCADHRGLLSLSLNHVLRV